VATTCNVSEARDDEKEFGNYEKSMKLMKEVKNGKPFQDVSLCH